MAALQEGNLVQAIRITRLETGGGLRDTKEALERHLAANPLLREQYVQALGRHRGDFWRRAMRFGLLLIVAALAWRLISD